MWPKGRTGRGAVAVAVLALVAACGVSPSGGGSESLTETLGPLPAPSTGAVPSAQSAIFATPDPRVVPGAVLSTTDTSRICPHVDPALERARPSKKVKDFVLMRDGVTMRIKGDEVDHLVMVALMGANTPDNLWYEKFPQKKERLENELHRRVCSGRMTLKAAQDALARNWPATYLLIYGSFKS